MEPSEREKQTKEESVFKQEVKRDFSTFKRLHGKKRLGFIFDYFKWKIVAAITAVICIVLAISMIIQGQTPMRLRVCVVLNNEEYCTQWFDTFYEQLSSDGDTTAIDVNEDQPFDYDNQYYNIQEIEVMTKISSRLMDAAVCGPDMFKYLLSLNACAPLDEVLDAKTFEDLSSRNMVVSETAGLTENKDGSIDRSDAAAGYFALDISDTAFGREYNAGEEDSLYFIIIRDNQHMKDCITLAKALAVN